MTVSQTPETGPELVQAPVGEIVSINGTRARVLLAKGADGAVLSTENQPFVGTIVTVDTGQAIVMCLITAMTVAKADTDPVLTGNRLYIRNAQEAACFELPLAAKNTD